MQEPIMHWMTCKGKVLRLSFGEGSCNWILPSLVPTLVSCPWWSQYIDLDEHSSFLSTKLLYPIIQFLRVDNKNTRTSISAQALVEETTTGYCMALIIFYILKDLDRLTTFTILPSQAPNYLLTCFSEDLLQLNKITVPALVLSLFVYKSVPWQVEFHQYLTARSMLPIQTTARCCYFLLCINQGNELVALLIICY